MVDDVSHNIKVWERKNQEKLGRLVALLGGIIAKSEPHGQVSIRYSASKDSLYINQCEAKKMFPEELYKKWRRDGELRKSDQA